MMVDDEPLIRKLVKQELNERGAHVERGDIDGTELRHVVMTDTFDDEPSLMSVLNQGRLPDYLLVDMELQGDPTGGLTITRHVHGRHPGIRIIIFSGRFDNPLPTDSDRRQRLVEIGRVVTDALHYGASAFVSKNAMGGFSVENILHAIACLERGEQCHFNYPVMLTLKEAAEEYFALTATHAPAETISASEQTMLLLEAAGCTAQEISDHLHETEKAIQERQKDLSRRLGIVNKSAARVAKAIALGLINAADVKFLPR